MTGDARGQPAPSPATSGVSAGERSVGELVSDLGSELSTHVQTHLALARAEIREDVRTATRAGLLASGAGLAAFVAVLLLSAAAAWALAEVMATGLAFLIVGGAWAVVAAALALLGKQRADALDPGPHQTVEEIKEDKRWATAPSN
ncbi:MAG: phage holin family protein [Actinomycetota bacterium]|nr:phage holin family protein [Actinomycetota bacterium]